MSFRLGSDEMRRLDKASDYCGMSKQAFVQAAVLSEINRVEEGRRDGRKYRPVVYENKKEEGDKPQAERGGLGLGLGLSETLQQQQRQQDLPAAEVPAAPVVVNVGSGAAGGNDVVDRLADWCAASNEFERERRYRVAAEILRASAANDQEHAQLIERLKLATSTKAKAAATTGGGISRAARLAFDKIIGIIGEK